MLQQWLNDEPNTTAKGLFIRLNTEMPNQLTRASTGLFSGGLNTGELQLTAAWFLAATTMPSHR
jgi:hypothetical protein